MLFAIDDMLDNSNEENNMANLWKHYIKHLNIIIDCIKDGVDWHVKYKRFNKPEIVLNLLCHGPVERGLDMSAGGVDIMNFACDASALATVANSFAAIEQRVEREKRLTWQELQAALKSDFAGDGGEEIRLMLSSVPQYGAGNTAADGYAERISAVYGVIMRGTPTKDGYIILPGLFSHGDIYMLGRDLGATPNGRKAGEPVSHSADPDPGFMPGGGTAPTAKANAVARVQNGWGNSTPLQIDIDARLANEMGGIENIKAYIRAHNQMGGTLININVVSKEKILEAHKDPLKYPDLVVRVTGYSAFFHSLSPEYRQQVVDRWLEL
jgi:formate C-acetyltransferase